VEARTRRPGRPKGVQEDPEERRERLLVAAEAAILRHGPAVSMDQVAQVAEVSRSTLYDNFASRSELSVAIIDRFGQPLLHDLLDGLHTPLLVEDLVRRCLRTYLDHVEARPEIYRFVIRNIADDALYLGVSSVFAGLVAAALPDGDPTHEVAEDLGSAALGAIVSATERWSDRRRPPRKDFEAALGDFIWGGLVAGGIAPDAALTDLASVLGHRR
jgi:AcrR family transcriptional regulator